MYRNIPLTIRKEYGEPISEVVVLYKSENGFLFFRQGEWCKL